MAIHSQFAPLSECLLTDDFPKRKVSITAFLAGVTTWLYLR